MADVTRKRQRSSLDYGMNSPHTAQDSAVRGMLQQMMDALEALAQRVAVLEARKCPTFEAAEPEPAKAVTTLLQASQYRISRYDVFPAIPGGPKIIWYNGDSQLWGAGPGMSVWVPMMLFTDETGAPGT